MKRLMSGVAVIIGLSLTASVMAQSKAPTVGSAPFNTSSKPAVKNPAFHGLHVRMRQILQQIQKDLKTNKITKSQGTQFHQQVKSVRIQEINWLKASGSNTLTSDQITQLNQQLDPIAAAL